MSAFYAWYYGPDGQARIFDDCSKVPAGWRDHPFAGDAGRSAAAAFDRDGKNGPGGSLPNNLFKLQAIAKAEGIALGDARRVVDVQAAILAARSA